MLHDVHIHQPTMSKCSQFLNKELPNEDHDWTLTELHTSRIAPPVKRSTGGALNTKPTIVILVFTLVWNQQQS